MIHERNICKDGGLHNKMIKNNNEPFSPQNPMAGKRGHQTEEISISPDQSWKLWGNHKWLFITGLMCIGRSSQTFCLPPLHLYFIVSTKPLVLSFVNGLCKDSIVLQLGQLFLCEILVFLWDTTMAFSVNSQQHYQFLCHVVYFLPQRFLDLLTCFSPLL